MSLPTAPTVVRRVEPKARSGSSWVAAILGLLCSSCVYARILFFNIPTLGAPSMFDNRSVAASTTPAPLSASIAEPRVPLTEAERDRYGSFDALLTENETRAFLVLHDDAIVYERYFGRTSRSTRLPSFSMSKTFAAVLVGSALAEGLIRSADQSVVAYIPELASKSGYAQVTLDELLRMTSGIDFNEESVSGAILYYSTDLRAHMYGYDVKWTPGVHYLYGSVNIQLLWDVIHRRLGEKTVSQYFAERIWGPLGAVSSAAWSLDSASRGVEKLAAGFSATARDQARLGLLFLHEGTMNGKTIVTREWVRRSLSPDPVAGVVHTADGNVRRGEYQWFLTLDGRGYFAKGYHGQYIFVVPDKHAVFVRFGEGYGHVDWCALFERIADSL